MFSRHQNCCWTAFLSLKSRIEQNQNNFKITAICAYSVQCAKFASSTNYHVKKIYSLPCAICANPVHPPANYQAVHFQLLIFTPAHLQIVIAVHFVHFQFVMYPDTMCTSRTLILYQCSAHVIQVQAIYIRANLSCGLAAEWATLDFTWLGNPCNTMLFCTLCASGAYVRKSDVVSINQSKFVMQNVQHHVIVR